MTQGASHMVPKKRISREHKSALIESLRTHPPPWKSPFKAQKKAIHPSDEHVDMLALNTLYISYDGEYLEEKNHKRKLLLTRKQPTQ